jgi:hypothetical protein
VEIYLSLGIGVVGGLIATALVGFFQAYWKGIILPWYQRAIYKDILLEKEWICETEIENIIWKATLQLKQNAHEITGNYIYTEGRAKGSIYNVKGELRNKILTLVYESNDVHCLDRGTITLMVKANGISLEGHFSYYDDPTDSISSAAFNCKKK